MKEPDPKDFETIGEYARAMIFYEVERKMKELEQKLAEKKP